MGKANTRTKRIPHRRMVRNDEMTVEDYQYAIREIKRRAKTLIGAKDPWVQSKGMHLMGIIGGIERSAKARTRERIRRDGGVI